MRIPSLLSAILFLGFAGAAPLLAADPIQHRSVAACLHCRCRLLQHRQPESLRGKEAGGLHLHQPAAARPEAQAIKGPSSQRSRCQRPDGAEAQIQSRPSDLCRAQNRGGTSIWPDQRGQRPGSVPITGSRAGERGMGPDGHHPQPAQAVQGINGNGLRPWFMSPRLQSDIPELQVLNHRFLASAQRATGS